MKPNELMVGNKLYRCNQIVTVKQLILGDDDILICEEPGLFTLGYTVQPIPLTTEILERCGFELYKHPKGGESAKVCIQLSAKRYLHIVSINNVRAILAMVSEGSSQVAINFTPYLHQLQNLFYSLTGEELNYQP